MKVDTIKGSSYAVTCTKACTVRAVLNTGGDSMLILEAQEKGQHGFTAPTDSVEVSVGDALITKASKTAVPGLSVRGGILPGEDAVLKHLTAEPGTFTGSINDNGGINIRWPWALRRTRRRSSVFMPRGWPWRPSAFPTRLIL